MAKKRCYVCKNTVDNYPGKFHMFPKNIGHRIDWFRQIGIPEEEQKSLLTARLYICTEHLDKNSDNPVVITQKLSHCVVGGCEKRTTDFNAFATHRFPLDVPECVAWIKFARNPYLAEQYALHGPIGVRNWRICSQHFEPVYYRRPSNKKQGLKPGALPTLHPADGENDELTLFSSQSGLGLETQGSFSLTVNNRKFKQGNNEFDGFHATSSHRTSRAMIHSSGIPSGAELMPNISTIDQNTQTEDLGFVPGPLPIPVDESDCCRLCFTTARLEPLCSGTIMVRDEMLDKIYVCTGILILPKPKQSIFICQPCAQTIDNFHTYRQQVASNNRALATYFARKARVDIFNDYPLSLVADPPKSNTRPLVRRRQYAKKRKTPKPVPYVKEESSIDLHGNIKLEPVDPLEHHEEPHSNSNELSIESATDSLYVEFLPEDTQTITMSSEPPEDSPDLDDSSEVESWECWHCGITFAFKFECAKHLLHIHREDVSVIEMRLELDELNCNMLEMMSENDRSQSMKRKRNQQ